MMQYKFMLNDNYGDFASGKVIFNKPGITNYPVRLAGEVFLRCLKYLTKSSGLVLYDPCCGGGYILTVLGLIFYDRFIKIYGSDIDRDSIELAKKNLSLLTVDGLERREEQIDGMIVQFKKESHMDAVKSIKRIKSKFTGTIESELFVADILDEDSLVDKKFVADIIIVDVPYGNLVNWYHKSNDELNILLSTIRSVLNKDTIIALSHTKNQKYAHIDYRLIEKIKIGHRAIDILKLK